MTPIPKLATIHLEALDRQVVTFQVEGLTPLIANAWSEEARLMMRAKQELGSQRALTSGRKAKDFDAQAEASLQRLDGEPAVPAAAFRQAMVSACRLYSGITMTAAWLLFYVRGEGPDQLVRVKGDVSHRVDPVRNETGVADLRPRAQVWPWSAEVAVEFWPHRVSDASLGALLAAAGLSVGIGGWRPERKGTFGTWRVL